jgi:hypothetical protein
MTNSCLRIVVATSGAESPGEDDVRALKMLVQHFRPHVVLQRCKERWVNYSTGDSCGDDSWIFVRWCTEGDANRGCTFPNDLGRDQISIF